MGKINKAPQESNEPREIRCRYRAEVTFVTRPADVPTWLEYVKKDLPESYGVAFHGKLPHWPLYRVTLAYEAASANGNDVNRRLRAADMYFVPIESGRIKLCDCPSGTTRCKERTND